MPLVLEPEAKSGFDPATATTLYWKQVPVLLKQSEREDQTEQLTFRILSGVSRQNHNLRVRQMALPPRPAPLGRDLAADAGAPFSAGASLSCF